MGSSSMKVHNQFPRGLLWEHEPLSSLTLGCCNRLRPLAPKLPHTATAAAASTAAFDLKSYIRPESGPKKSDHKPETAQVIH